MHAAPFRGRMHRLYPETRPYCELMLPTHDGHHQLWTALYGNPDGLPVVCLHGGPGSGTSPLMPRFFDPQIYNILCFDQRGCGQSTPSGSLVANSTEHLLSDLDMLTDYFGLKRFVLFGGSWGATLAILYAMRQSDRCLGLILRGVFLNTADNLRWLYQDGASKLYPAAWADFIAPLAKKSGSLEMVLDNYQRLLHADDQFTQLQAARAWNLWEHRLSTCNPQAYQTGKSQPSHEIATAQIEHHFLSQSCFLDHGILDSIDEELRSMQMILLHGSQDHVCPIQNAHDLKRAYPNVTLKILEKSGHCAFSPQMAEGLCQAANEMATLYGH